MQSADMQNVQFTWSAAKLRTFWTLHKGRIAPAFGLLVMALGAFILPFAFLLGIGLLLLGMAFVPRAVQWVHAKAPSVHPTYIRIAAAMLGVVFLVAGSSAARVLLGGG